MPTMPGANGSLRQTAVRQSLTFCTFASFETERHYDYVVINRCQSSSCADPEQIATRLSGDHSFGCPPGWNLDGTGTCTSPCPYDSRRISVDGVFACYICPKQNDPAPSRRPYPSQSNSGAEPTCQTCPGTNMFAWGGSCYSCPAGTWDVGNRGDGPYCRMLPTFGCYRCVCLMSIVANCGCQSIAGNCGCQSLQTVRALRVSASHPSCQLLRVSSSAGARALSSTPTIVVVTMNLPCADRAPSATS